MKTAFYALLLFLLTPGRAAAQSGNMETWRNYTASPLALPLEAPVGWYGSDSAMTAVGYAINPGGTFKQQVFKTTASHTGSYAVKLMTRSMSWRTSTSLPYVAVLSNARMSVDTSVPHYANAIRFSGGTPVSQRIPSVSFWLMQDSVHPDKSMIQVMALLAGQGAGGKDSVVGDSLLSLYVAPGPGYYRVTLPIPYSNSTVVPDHIAVAVYSGSFYVATVPYDSATIYVDDISLNTPSGISYSILKEPAIRCLHHRSGGYLEVHALEPAPMRLEVLDAAGRRVGTYPFSGQTRINLPGNQPEGLLFYRITDSRGQLKQQGKFMLVE